MAELYRIYLILIGARIRCQMQYKVSFVLEVLGTLASSGADLIVLLVMFMHVDELAGWTMPETLLLYGLSTLSFALCELLLGGFDYFSTTIRTGQFDNILIRPLPDFVQILSAEFVLRRLARAALGLVMLLWAILKLRSVFDISDYIWVVGSVLNGTLIYGFLFIIQASCCFWTVDSVEAFNILTYGGNAMLSHPIDIYTDWIKKLFLFVVPMAFMNYIPAAYILGKPLAFDLPRQTVLICPLIGPALLLLGWRVWKFGVRHYQSTGS